MFARVTAGLDGVFLVVTVNRFLHALGQQPRLVRVQQPIPIRAPDHLDHIPARTTECRLQFLDDLAIAAYGTVETLEIAVDHPNQVVESLARGQSQRAERFGFIALAVANEAPHLRLLSLNQAARSQVPIEPRLINRHDRTEPHRYRWELPEIRHQIRMRRSEED